MTCPSNALVCIVNGGGGGTAWWVTMLQIGLPAVAVVVAAILTQTISARRTREREQATSRALTQRETARELADRAVTVWQQFTEYDGKPPESMEAARSYLADHAAINSLSYRLDDESTGEGIRAWLLLLQYRVVDRLQGKAPASSDEWGKLKNAHDVIQKNLGSIYRNPGLYRP